MSFRETATDLILLALREAKAPRTAVELAAELALAPSTAFNLLHRLGGNGLVCRGSDRPGLITWEATR